MHYLTLVCVVLEFHAVVILSLRQHFNYDRQPYGPRMCQDLCRRIVGCSQYVFAGHHLVCRVNNKRDAIAAERSQTITKKSSGPSRDCAWNTLVFSTRSGRPQCARVSEGARLLVVQSKNLGKKQMREADLCAATARNYPFINDEHIHALAYVPSRRRILVATSRPHRIKSFILDNYVSSTIIKKWSAYGLCVDDSKQLVFFAAFNLDSKSHCRICRMTTTGKDFRIIYTDMERAVDITIDPSKQFIYFSQVQKIRRTNYDGENVSIAYRGNHVQGIAFDPTKDVLFFKPNRKYVIQNIYFRNFATKARRLKLKPINIVIYENTAYVSTPSRKLVGPLLYFSLKDNDSAFSLAKVLPPKLFSKLIFGLIL